jgi:2'-5' RNA ligase
MKIAIDIVLLLPEEVKNLCISINNKANVKGDADAPLGKDDFIPHLSLCIAVIDEKNYHKLLQILDEINSKPIEVEINKIVRASEEISSDMFIAKKTEDLQKLHEEIMDKVKDLLEFKTDDPDVIFRKPGESVEKIPTTFENGYLNYAYKNYDPHVTLRCRNSIWDKFPIKFNSRKIALFHVGRNVTCRKLLWQKELKI